MNSEQLITTEDRLVALWNDGEINALTHFDGSADGSYERWLCTFFAEHVRPQDWKLVSHRAHYLALLSGMSPDRLVEQVLAGKSMFLYMERFIQSAIVGGLCGVAAGLALSIQQRGGDEKVFCFLGDGGEDQGCLYEAVRFVHGRRLPCQFIITDNDRQCGVSKAQRHVGEFAWPSCVTRVRYQPKYPHGGTNVRPTLKRQTPA